MTGVARSGDFWSGIALAGLGVFIVSQAWGWTYTGDDGPGAGFFPRWYGGAMIALSLALVAGTVLKPSASPKAVRWREVGRAFSCWLAFVAAIVLMRWLGFAVAFALLTWFIVKVMAGESHRRALVAAVGFALAFYLVFDLALDLALPRGLLF